MQTGIIVPGFGKKIKDKSGRKVKEKGKRRKAKVKNQKSFMGENDLQDRLFRFAFDVINMLRILKGGADLKVISNQLIKAAISAGANYSPCQIASK